MTRLQQKQDIPPFWQQEYLRMSLSVAAVAIPMGMMVGAAIAAYDYVVNTIIWGSFTSRLSSSALCFLPLFGMIFTGAVLKLFRVASSAMADEIVKIYHAKMAFLDFGELVPKLFASICTMGFGCSAGMEGASKWFGGMLGALFQRWCNRFPRAKFLHGTIEKTMLVGAAAGIAAIFRAPLTGAIMGIESPYKKDLAHDVLIHALVASAISYATFYFLRDGNPYFALHFKYSLNYLDLVKCVGVGVGAGVLSQVFLLLLRSQKKMAHDIEARTFPMLPFIVGGILLSLIAYLALISVGEPVTLQAGLPIANKLLDGNFPLIACLLILFAKMLATAVTFGMGGVGGLFLPSATIGAAYGACCDLLFLPSQPGLFTLVGISAFTGASYNSLLFSAVFIAEASGNPALVVPGLIASSFAYLFAAGISNSPSQRVARVTHS